MQYHLIYKTTNIINNKSYVGQHRTTVLDDGYLGSGILIRNAFKKYGKENFRKDIIYISFNGQDLCEKEAHFIELFNTHVSVGGYNLMKGDKSSIYHDDSSKLKISLAMTGSKNPFFGKKHKNETRERMKGRKLGTSKWRRLNQFNESNPFYGKKHTEEYKQRQRELNSGENNSQSKIYEMTSPNGITFKFTLKCNFVKFCSDNNISATRLTKFMNSGPVVYKNDHTLKSTTEGWSLNSYKINPHH